MERSGREFDGMHDQQVPESLVTAEQWQDEDMSAVSSFGLPQSLHPSMSYQSFNFKSVYT